jgi:hypothetical protein
MDPYLAVKSTNGLITNVQQLLLQFCPGCMDTGPTKEKGDISKVLK